MKYNAQKHTEMHEYTHTPIPKNNLNHSQIKIKETQKPKLQLDQKQ